MGGSRGALEAVEPRIELERRVRVGGERGAEEAEEVEAVRGGRQQDSQGREENKEPRRDIPTSVPAACLSAFVFALRFLSSEASCFFVRSIVTRIRA